MTPPPASMVAPLLTAGTSKRDETVKNTNTKGVCVETIIY